MSPRRGGRASARGGPTARAARQAIEDRDLEGLLALIRVDAEITDAANHRTGGALVAQVLLDVLPPADSSARVSAQSVNGREGLIFRCGERVIAIAVLRTRGRRIAEVWLIEDPARLRDWNR